MIPVFTNPLAMPTAFMPTEAPTQNATLQEEVEELLMQAFGGGGAGGMPGMDPYGGGEMPGMDPYGGGGMPEADPYGGGMPGGDPYGGEMPYGADGGGAPPVAYSEGDSSYAPPAFPGASGAGGAGPAFTDPFAPTDGGGDAGDPVAETHEADTEQMAQTMTGQEASGDLYQIGMKDGMKDMNTGDLEAIAHGEVANDNQQTEAAAEHMLENKSDWTSAETTDNPNAPADGIASMADLEKNSDGQTGQTSGTSSTDPGYTQS